MSKQEAASVGAWRQRVEELEEVQEKLIEENAALEQRVIAAECRVNALEYALVLLVKEVKEAQMAVRVQEKKFKFLEEKGEVVALAT